ncbi:MAG: EAL domain-containing protein [Pseudomonadota bacterium]
MTDLFALQALRAAGASDDDVIGQALRTIRQHLGMAISFLVERDQADAVLRVFDAPGHGRHLSVGARWTIDVGDIGPVWGADHPQLIADMRKTNAGERPNWLGLPVGAWIAVPVARADGAQFGLFGALSPDPDLSLNMRDMKVAQSVAGLLEKHIQPGPGDHDAHRVSPTVLDEIMSGAKYHLQAQPIVALDRGQVQGYEALCRFETDRIWDAAAVFAAAARVHRTAELEQQIIARALRYLSGLPSDIYLSINASPETVFNPGFSALFDEVHFSNLVLEITEHRAVDDYDALLARLAPLRQAGMRLAVDDTGMGHSGLHQILALSPDLIKLDRALVAGIDADAAKRAMCAAMVHYATETGATLVAEGIETVAEHRCLRDLGVARGQGYLFAHPRPLADLMVPPGSAA